MKAQCHLLKVLILNISQMSETFEFDVAYSTTFEKIEALRGKMLAFVKAERRDFLPSFDVVVIGELEHNSLVLFY